MYTPKNWKRSKRNLRTTAKALLVMGALVGAALFLTQNRVEAGGVGTAKIASVVSTGSACVALTNAGPNQFWDVQQGGTYEVTLTDVTECDGDTINVIVHSSSTGNISATATKQPDNSYKFTVTLPAGACFTYPVEYCTDGTPGSGKFAQQPNGNGHTGHLRAATFDGSCNVTGTDTDCGGATGEIEVCKWYDANGNGARDGSESGIPGWLVTLAPLPAVPTESDGCVSFVGLQADIYTISECLQSPPYTHSGLIVDSSPQTITSQPTSATVEVTGTGDSHKVEFGNYCRFQGDVRTIGYYKNNCSLAAPCTSGSFTLGSGTGVCKVTVTGCTQIINVLSGANAKDAMVMLKAQLLATKINICRNPTLANAFVPSLGMTVGQWVAGADAFIGGLTSCNLTTASANRTQALVWKDGLDAINNSGEGGGTVVINPTPCTTNCIAQ